jgi:hypothetical protein
MRPPSSSIVARRNLQHAVQKTGRTVDSKGLERDVSGKPAATFPHPALEHIPIRLNRSGRQEYAQAFDPGAISDRPIEAIRWESALEFNAGAQPKNRGVGNPAEARVDRIDRARAGSANILEIGLNDPTRNNPRLIGQFER